MSTPYHVRLAVSQYGEQFRAELFTEDLGDTEGDLLTELPPSIAEWVPYLAQGADLPPDAARQLGKDLFAVLLGQPENAKKWAEVLAQAGRKGQPIRLLIDATTEAVRDLPYGLLCEPHDDWFLFRGGKKTSVEFVRILRRCSPRPLNLRARPRVLIAVAEPQSADVPPFDAPRRLQKLAAAVHKYVDLIVCGPDGPKPLTEIAPNPDTAEPATFAPYTKTTRDQLRTALVREFDVVHLLAHGHGAGVLLCAAAGTPAETTASELAEWCSAGRAALAFLQVCKAGQTASRGGFGGVAQQLLNPRGGNFAAVVASTFPLDAEHSTDAAVGFYRQLAAGKSPEAALTADRAETDWCWAFLELWARPGALSGTQQRAAFQFVSPYRGLSSFGEQDADLFFGRKTEVTELLNILRAEPVIAVVGDSGSGKTSLLQAGLVHAVRREGLAGSDRWRIVSLRPGYRPAQALLTALGGSPAEPTPEVLRTALRVDAQPLLIIFDQFEELFTLARDRAEVQMLTDALAEAVTRQRDRFRLILGMRSEFLGQAASVRGLSGLIRRPWVLRPPSTNDLRDIVAGPAENCGYTFQGPLADGTPAHAVGLIDRILADPLLAHDKDGAPAAPLPLLQFALERLWLKAVEKGVTEFTHAEFDEIGGMGKAIAQHAEAVFQAAPTATELGSPARALAEQIITALVSTRETRQPRARDPLQAETGNPDAARTVVDYLVGERLLTVRTDPEDLSRSLVDLSHEALIHNWDRLRGWLAEDPQGRAMREEFRTAAEKWENGFAGAQPRSWFALPSADVARNYLAWIDTSKPRLAPVQQEFAQAMRAMLARIKRTRRAVMGALAGLALVALVLAVVAVLFADRAQKDKAAALQSEKDARASEAKAEAERAKADDERKKAEAERLKAEIEATNLALDKGIQLCEEGQPRLGVLALAAGLRMCPPEAPDLKRVILTLLAAWSPHLLCLDDVRRLPGPILATDRNGKYALLELPVAGAERGTRVRLYNIDTLKPVGPEVASDGYQIMTAVVLPSGIALLTGDRESTVRDMITGRHIGKKLNHSFGYTTLSPDAKIVAIGAENGDVKFWDVETGTAHPDVYSHQGKITALTFSADGRRFVTGCGRRATLADKPDPKKGPTTVNLGVVHLFNVDPETNKAQLRKRLPVAQPVTAVQISTDNRYLTGGSLELHTWRLDDTDSTKDCQPLDTRHSLESTVQIAFEPAASADFLACTPSGSLQLLHADDPFKLAGERLSPQGWLAGVGFRPDGRIFTANSDGVVRIWNRPRHDVHEVTRARVFRPPHAGALLCVAFRGDGRAFTVGSRNGLVFFYDLEKGGDPKEFRCAYQPMAERHQVADVRFSTDGKRIIALDDHLTPFVFEVSGDPVPIKGKYRPVGVADDGVTAIVNPERDVYQVSEVGAKGPPTGPKFIVPGGVLAYHDEGDDDYYLRVSCVAFTPDRSIVALIDRAGGVHMFRTATGESVRGVERGPIRHVVDEVPDGIRSICFCPAGESLVTRSDKARGLWKARNGNEVHLHTGGVGVQVARFSPTGRLLIAGTNFNRVQVWDRTGKDVVPGLMFHEAHVWGVAANRAETRIITASADKSARIWDLATGRPISPPLFHERGVSDAAFSPDGTRALTVGWDGTARLWDVPEPLPNEVKRIVAWVETMTGLQAGDEFTGALLSAKDWTQSKRQLDGMGGPPDVK
jgi:WD40 repeat protein